MPAKFSRKLSRFLEVVQRCWSGCKLTRSRSVDLGSDKGNQRHSIRVTNDLRQISSFYEFTSEVLGKGRFGETKIVVHKQTRQKYACKSVLKAGLKCLAEWEALKREIHFLKLFKGYDSIASFHDVFEDSTSVHIILELCTGGELFDRIVERKRFSEPEAAMMMRSILLTVVLCHDHYIVHSDLKPENFIFSRKGPGAVLKSIDFGVSQMCQEGFHLTDPAGTVKYMAPDVLDKKYSFPADVWTCGVMLYLLISGQMPFHGETKEDIEKATRHWDINYSFQPWPSVSPSLKRCINRMLDRNPKTRATAREILFSDWMKEQLAAPLEPIPNTLFSKLHRFSKYNLLKKLSLKLIAGVLPESEKVALSALFRQLKGSKSEAISASQLEAAFVCRGGSRIRKIDILQLMRDINSPGINQICYLDFIAANMRLGQLASDENINYVFSLLDEDQNGYVTSDELKAFLEKYSAPQEPTPRQIRTILETTDINGDGIIDLNEFRALMRGSF